MRISVADLACRRAGRLVFVGLTFALEPGDALVVTGRNGAGKSTLLAALAGAVRPARGTIATTGAGDRSRLECVGLLGQREALKGALTPSENLRFAAALLGPGGGLKPGSALDRVGLGHAAELPTAYLSAGQRRRLALARLLVATRPIWLLDEPTTALDQDGQALLSGLMAEHRAAGGMIVAATHGPLPLPGAATLDLAREPTEHPFGLDGSGFDRAGFESAGRDAAA